MLLRWTRRAEILDAQAAPGPSLLAEAGADVINIADSPMAASYVGVGHIRRSAAPRQPGDHLHFPTHGRNLLRVQGDLLAAHALGIRNVLVIMGDPTAIGDYPEAMDSYGLVPSGLIKLIKQGFNVGVDHSGTSIGQPTNFFVGAALNLCAPDPEQETGRSEESFGPGRFFCDPANLSPRAGGRVPVKIPGKVRCT